MTRSRRNLQERDGKNAGSCRNTPEVIGTWKQYSGRKIPDFFRWFPTSFWRESTGKWSECTGKNPEIFRPEYCFHVPVTSGLFLPEPSRILWPGSSLLQRKLDYTILWKQNTDSWLQSKRLSVFKSVTTWNKATRMSKSTTLPSVINFQRPIYTNCKRRRQTNDKSIFLQLGITQIRPTWILKVRSEHVCAKK